MPLKLVNKNNLTLVPWKNGQGVTEQVDLKNYQEKWLWRISIAHIEKENSFSEFPNYNRLLTIIEGEGFYLNKIPYKLNQIHFFHGEDPIQCEPISGIAKDLGIIFDRHLVSATMDYLIFNESLTIIDKLFPINFLYCKKGQACSDDLYISAGEFFKIENQSQLSLSAIHPGSEFFLIKILCCF